MTVVAFLAVFVATVRAATRPIPVPETVDVATGKIHWSDGVVARMGEASRPVETTYYDMSALAWYRVRLGLRMVRWSEGSFSYRLPEPFVPIRTPFGTPLADRSEGQEQGENPSLYPSRDQSPVTPP
jgi:hypothetical protein